MSFDNQELKETRRRNGLSECNYKEKVEKIIRNRINEIDNEEWDIANEKEIKFYCMEELESILFKIKKEVYYNVDF